MTTAERRRVSVLFADLVDFTAMTERHDPEDVRASVEAFFAMARVTVDAWGGRVDQFLGDGLMAVFGDRIALEDDAERAVRAAVDIRDGTARLPPVIAGWSSLAVRIGVATGTAVTAAGASGVTSPLGDPVNIAARLQGVAGPSEVVICEVTRSLVNGVADTAALGPQHLKGKQRPVAAFRVESVGSGDRSAQVPVEGGRSALVGREREMAGLAGAVDDLVEHGRGGQVLVVGQPGVGKTRLFDDLRGALTAPTAPSLPGGPRVAWFDGRARALGLATPYGPVRDVVAAIAGIDRDHGDAVISERLADLVDGLALAGHDVLGPLLRLFATEDPAEAAIDREGFQGRLANAVETLVTAVAARTPVVLCLQDLHWADPSTIGLMRRIAPRISERVLVLANSRPDAEPDLGPGVRRLHLADLSEGDVARLVASRLGGSVDPALSRFVCGRSGGNPFFAEEVLNTLLDEGSLVRSPAGWRLGPDARTSQVPGTVQGVIAARLDRLAPASRDCIRQAAVVGREFAVDDLLGMDPGTDHGPALRDLERADLVRGVGDGRYEFKHALTLDVVQDGLTKHERRRLHLAAARSIEARVRDRRAEFADVLGSHYHQAGEVEQAVHHLCVAGRRALDRYAIDESDALYGLAYRMTVDEGTPEQRARLLGPLLVQWVLVHYYRGSWRDATDLLAQHEADIDATGDPGVRGMALAWRGFSAAVASADIGESLHLLDQAVAIGEASGRTEVLAHAHSWRAWARFLEGRHAEAVADGERVAELVEGLTDDRYPRIKSAGAIGLAHLGAGRFDECRQAAQWLVETGRATGSTRAESLGLAVLSLAATLTGDPDGGAQLGADAVEAATDPIFRDMARLMAVHGMVAAGRLVEARSVHADMVESCTAHRLDGLLLAVAPAGGVLQVLEGDLSRGMRSVDESIAAADLAGSRFLASMGRVYRAGVRARAATGEVTVPLAVLARNPGFVLRHALPGRRRVAAELVGLVATLPRRGGAGLVPMAEAELARLRAPRQPSAR